MSRKKVLTVGLIGLLSFTGIFFAVLLFLREDNRLIPSRYTEGLTYTLYYPQTLPDGYSVDRNSFRREGDVLIFSIKAPKGKNIAVSEQATPNDVALRKTIPTPFATPAEKNFSTPIGSAHTSLWGDKFVTDITTEDGVWIILNTTGFTADEAAAVATSFSKL